MKIKYIVALLMIIALDLPGDILGADEPDSKTQPSLYQKTLSAISPLANTIKLAFTPDPNPTWSKAVVKVSSGILVYTLSYQIKTASNKGAPLETAAI